MQSKVALSNLAQVQSDAMAPKLKNRSFGLKEAREYAAKALAKDMAIAALECWYRTGYKRANALMPHIQVESNFEEVAAIPGWQEQKGPSNGCVMLTNVLDWTLKPCILQIDYEGRRWGGSTGRQLHKQVRTQQCLKPKQSLRMVPARPWYRYVLTGVPIPEHRRRAETLVFSRPWHNIVVVGLCALFRSR